MEWCTDTDIDIDTKTGSSIPILEEYQKICINSYIYQISKVPKVSNAMLKRNLNGMKKCGKCTICTYIKEGRKIKSTATN